MADAVRTIVVSDYERSPFYIANFTCISDGTGETTVVKVDKSAIEVAPDGAEPAALDIAWIRWNIQGFASVRLLWDHTTDDVARVLSGSGYEEYLALPGVPQMAFLADPRSTGGTGDLLLTSNGAVNGATYDITIGLRKATE